MREPSTLPIEARRAAWDALWRRLLAPIPDDDPEPDEQDDNAADAISARIDGDRWERAQMVEDVEAASVHEFLTTWKATLAS